MIGLLGTVLGMIKSFLQIGSADIQGVRQMELASGISEALITTAAGLFVGIPALAFYSLFRGRVQKYIAELEAAATHLIALLQSNEEKPKNATLPSTPHLPSQDQDPLFSKDRRDLHGI
jgi:biopolymer transport protein ExbB